MTKNFMAAVVAAIFVFFASVSVLAEPSPEVVKLQQQVIFPAVRIINGDGRGSGTIFYHAEENGQRTTFVLTNFHVVKMSAEKKTPIQVEVFNYFDNTRYESITTYNGNLVAADPIRDLAVIRIDSNDFVPKYVAKFMPVGERPYLGEPVWAVGSPIGAPPFVSIGVMGTLDRDSDGVEVVSFSAPIFHGNSGGGLYRKNLDGDYELVAVPTMILGTKSGGAVPHLAIGVTVTSVREFIAEVIAQSNLENH